MADIRVKPKSGIPIWAWVVLTLLVVVAVAAYVLTDRDVIGLVLALC